MLKQETSLKSTYKSGELNLMFSEKFSVNKRVGCAIKVKINFSYTLNINNL